MVASGTWKTASFSTSCATRTIICPPPMTWPTSAPTAVTTPAALDFSTRLSRLFWATRTAACAASTPARAAFAWAVAASSAARLMVRG